MTCRIDQKPLDSCRRACELVGPRGIESGLRRRRKEDRGGGSRSVREPGRAERDCVRNIRAVRVEDVTGALPDRDPGACSRLNGQREGSRRFIVNPILLNRVRHDDIDVARECTGKAVRDPVKLRSREYDVTGSSRQIDLNKVKDRVKLLTKTDRKEVRAIADDKARLLGVKTE